MLNITNLHLHKIHLLPTIPLHSSDLVYRMSTFVNRGSTVAIDGAEALVAPFDENAGAGQEVTMTLSNNTTSVVSYDETTNSVTVESNSYSPGDSFILDGKKVVVFDL